MHDIYFWTTPNGYKLLLFAEEAGIDYTIKPVNISRGEQFAPEFLEISPNNRMPALVDHAPRSGKGPISVFESGAILLYLAEKFGKFIPSELSGRVETLQWLFWQMANLGPMAGQSGHFRNYAPEKIAYAIERYGKEVNRLYGVLNKRLRDRAFMAGPDYTIADMATYPWINPQMQGQNPEDFPHVVRWKAAIAERPSTIRAYEIGKSINTTPSVTEESRKFLFGQTAATIDK
jgi:GST-like protein